MRILALDTATENCSAALLLNGHLSAREQRFERGHAERILPMVDELLAEAGVALRDLTALAFGRGPGAFTGVRLAASIVQGLGFGAALPVVPISDLRAMAQRTLEEHPAASHVLVCHDARMREVYWGCFERSPDGLALALGEERVGEPGSVVLPASWSGHPVDGAGTGFAAYPALKERLEPALRHIDARLLPRAAEVARLAVPEVAAGRVLPANQALPAYLRDTVTHRDPTGH